MKKANVITVILLIIAFGCSVYSLMIYTGILQILMFLTSTFALFYMVLTVSVFDKKYPDMQEPLEKQKITTKEKTIEPITFENKPKFENTNTSTLSKIDESLT